jgi:hypothetical protein
MHLFFLWHGSNSYECWGTLGGVLVNDAGCIIRVSDISLTLVEMTRRKTGHE